MISAVVIQSVAENFVKSRSSMMEDLVRECAEIMSREIPAGAFTEKQKFPEGFENWSEERKAGWFEGAARAIYLTQAEHHSKIHKDMRKAIDTAVTELLIEYIAR